MLRRFQFSLRALFALMLAVVCFIVGFYNFALSRELVELREMQRVEHANQEKAMKELREVVRKLIKAEDRIKELEGR